MHKLLRGIKMKDTIVDVIRTNAEKISSMFVKSKKKKTKDETLIVSKKPEEIKTQFIYRDDTYFEYEDFN